MINSVSGLPAIFIEKMSNPNLHGQDAKESSSEIASALTRLENQLSNLRQDHSTEATDQRAKLEIKAELNYNKIADKISGLLESSNLAIEFTKDKDTQKMIMKVYDSVTDEVIQQFPPETSLKIARIVASILEKGNFAETKV